MFAIGFLLLALLTAAAPPVPVTQVTHPMVTLPIARRIRASTRTIPEIDRARAAEHLARAKSLASPGQLAKRQSSFNVTNQAVMYTASVGVGSPPTTYQLIIDTGSSNTWIGAEKAYTPTSTSHETRDVVGVAYGSGFFVGREDSISLGPGSDSTLSSELEIEQQSIGVAIVSIGFNGVDGILGVGPTGLTEGTVLSSNDTVLSSNDTVLPSNDTVPTVTDNLASQKKIAEKVVGVFFAPSTSESETNGEMTFGGVDTSKTTSDITYVPITSTSPSSNFFGIDQTITYGVSKTIILSTTAGITDTGTTLLLLNTDAFNAYMALTGATVDQTTGLLSISPENYANLQSLFFNIGGTTFEFTKNAQTWPRSLNADIGGSSDGIFLIIGNIGNVGGDGLNFINGMTFLERFYSVFDSTNNRVGFATTMHTFDETN